MKTLQEMDYKHAAELLGVDVAALKAILEVETGNRGGFVAEELFCQFPHRNCSATEAIKYANEFIEELKKTSK